MEQIEDTRGDWYMEKEKAMSYLDDCIAAFRGLSMPQYVDKLLDVQSFVKDTECQ